MKRKKSALFALYLSFSKMAYVAFCHETLDKHLKLCSSSMPSGSQQVRRCCHKKFYEYWQYNTSMQVRNLLMMLFETREVLLTFNFFTLFIIFTSLPINIYANGFQIALPFLVDGKAQNIEIWDEKILHLSKSK